MCDELTVPEGERASTGGFYLDTLQRSVGSIVRVMCGNRTVAVLECKRNGNWNGTVPVCGSASSSDGHIPDMGTILIIVWVLGGILLFALLVLITIIISSRKKPERRINGQQPTTVFQISGQEGGDNPAFSRSEERTGSTTRLSVPEAGDTGRTDRLPSYQEAVMGGYIQAPATRGQDSPYFIRVNAPPSYRSSQQSQGLAQANAGRESTNGSNPGNWGDNDAGSLTQPNTLTTQATVHRTQVVQSPSASRDSPRRGLPVPPVSGASETQQSHASQRYVESYPNCFWEEDPPPPYTPGPSNLHLYRSPARNSQNRLSHHRNPPPRPRQRQPDFSDPPPPTSPVAQAHSTSTTIPTAPPISRSGQSLNSVSLPSSQPLGVTSVSSQMPYTIPSDSSMCHYSTINVHSNGHQPHNDYRVHTTSHNPSTFPTNQTMAVQQHQMPSNACYGHNRRQSHGNSPRPLHPSGHHISSSQPSCQPRHDRQRSAPIARLEVEYF